MNEVSYKLVPLIVAFIALDCWIIKDCYDHGIKEHRCAAIGAAVGILIWGGVLLFWILNSILR